MISNNNWVSQGAYAKHRGCTLRAVQKAMESNRITFVYDDKGHRKIPDIEQADREWAENTSHEKKRIPTRAQKARGIVDAGEVMDEAGSEPETLRGYNVKEKPKPPGAVNQGGDEKGAKYSTARAVREGYDAKLKQLKYEKELKLVVNADRADKYLFEIGKTIMENMLNISSRISDELAVLSTSFECKKILDDEIRQVLESTIAEGVKVPRE